MTFDEISDESHRLSFQTSLHKSFAPWSRMPPEEWPEEVYRLPGGKRFRWSFAPYTKGMYRSIFDRRTQETVFKIYSRGLKSTVILMAAGYCIDQSPRRMLFMWPTVGQAEKFSKDNLSGELLDTTPCLQYLGTVGNVRRSNNTILFKQYPGGLINIVGANAPGELRRAKANLLAADEIDAYEVTQTDEGDILAIFDRRGSEFPDTINIKSSYPSIKGYSRISPRYDESDGNQWFSTCLICGGEPFVMTRALLRYDKPKPEGALFECPRCHSFLNDRQRYSMAHEQGDNLWVPQREFRGKRGFHACSMLWPHPVDLEKFPGGFLQTLAQQEIDIEKSENPRKALRVLANTGDAEDFDPIDPSEKPPEWEAIFKRREDYTIVPEKALVLTVFADVQNNRIEILFQATAASGENWGLDYVVLDGNPKDDDMWKGPLLKQLQRKFKHALGGDMSLNMAFLDGAWASEYVFRFLRWLAQNPVEGVSGKVRASRGIGKQGHPIVDQKWASIAKNLKGHHMGTWEAKDLINQRLLMKPDKEGVFPDGYMHFNKNFDESFFKQLCTGVPTIVFERVQGQMEEVKKFLSVSGVRDEGLDTCVGCLAAFRLRRWQYETIAAELTVVEGEEEAVQEETSFVGRGGSMGGGWKL